MGEADLWILGINAYDHDVAACLLKNGEAVVAVEKERVSRAKHASGFHGPAVDYCLDAAGIDLERIDLVVANSYVLPVPEMERRLAHHHQPYHLPAAERKDALASPLWLSDRVRICSHHLAHAYSAFACAPFERGAVMVVDGVGSYRCHVLEDVPADSEAAPLARESESYYRFDGAELETVSKVWLHPAPGFLSDEFYSMAGLGALYSRVATYVFGEWDKAGEVMGLAPYGRAGRPPLLRLDADGRLEVPDWGPEFAHPFLGGGDAAWEKSPHRMEWEDLARRVQQDTEETLLARARALHERTGESRLVLAGGVALNCVANGRLLEETPFEEVWIQPAAGDGGIALGCALYGHVKLKERPRAWVMESAYLGRTYDRFDEDEAFRPRDVRFFTKRRKSDRVVDGAADLLADGKVIGWFQGGSEFGPRALGNRSILADPRDPSMKDRVNARVKHRQGFRPFAPVVLYEQRERFFEHGRESPFMLLVDTVRPEIRDKIPAVVHVDGTARVQTVRERQNPRLYALLRAFDERTGLGLLLNTSFNLRGDPIVEVPFDAVDCFLSTHLDGLVVHDWIVTKRWVHRPLFRFAKSFAQVRRGIHVT